jgi:hypothetical protein
VSRGPRRSPIDGLSAHHATDAMRCAAGCGPWPCRRWAVARAEADRRALLGARAAPTVVYPEQLIRRRP